jgi:hypothetical protein
MQARRPPRPTQLQVFYKSLHHTLVIHLLGLVSRPAFQAAGGVLAKDTNKGVAHAGRLPALCLAAWCKRTDRNKPW